MKKVRTGKDKNNYKVVISELGINPFRKVKVAFALMGVLPLLILFYIIIGKNFLYNLFLGSNGFMVGVVIFISVMGFLYAYNLIGNIVKQLLSYSYERKITDEEKTEFLLTVTHDLKTPLTVIKAGIKNLMDGIGGSVNKTQLTITQFCLEAVNKANDFINELLDASKRGFIRLNIKRELLNFEKIIRDEIDGIAKLAEKNSQEIVYKALIEDVNIWADNKKLSRAIMNLLSNAIKYTPSGGKIDVILSGNENTVKLAVANSGLGISRDNQNKIFNKYERLKADPSIEGTGLGLGIVKEIIDLHNGHLTLESIPGESTIFNVVLPRDLRSQARA